MQVIVHRFVIHFNTEQDARTALLTAVEDRLKLEQSAAELADFWVGHAFISLVSCWQISIHLMREISVCFTEGYIWWSIIELLLSYSITGWYYGMHTGKLYCYIFVFRARKLLLAWAPVLRITSTWSCTSIHVQAGCHQLLVLTFSCALTWALCPVSWSQFCFILKYDIGIILIHGYSLYCSNVLQ